MTNAWSRENRKQTQSRKTKEFRSTLNHQHAVQGTQPTTHQRMGFISTNTNQALTLPILLLIPLTHAAPEKRACAYTCASICYTSSAVSAAQSAGWNLYSSGQTDDSYPHEYHNYEGFNFPVSGTYYEFPILSDGDVYGGGEPGADRVIFNQDDQLAGVITHRGASGDDFVSC